MAHRVIVTVSDPWEFVDEHGSNVLSADVIRTEDDQLLLLMAGQHYVARARRDDGQTYSLVPVPPPTSTDPAPWGADDWRGVPAGLLADIRRA